MFCNRHALCSVAAWFGAFSVSVFATAAGNSPFPTVTENTSPVAEPPDALPPCCTAPGRFAHLAAKASETGKLSLEPTERGERVLIDGELFAEYRTDLSHQPVIWPIVGPSGHEMTRSLPLGRQRPAEKQDHPHHKSLWFAHGGVNGHDFWHLPPEGSDDQQPRIAHLKTLSRSSPNASVVVFTTVNDWLAAGVKQMTDRRTVAFGVLPSGDRYIDFTITMQSSQGPVEFADTKEGSFGVRVPGPMKSDAGLGGEIFNARGDRGDATWGRKTAWTAYQGPLTVSQPDETTPQGGIVIMSHPDSSVPECRWHVRSYGLFAANPFGVKEFSHEDQAVRVSRLADDEELTLRYRVVFYSGLVEPGVIPRWYASFAAVPLLEYASLVAKGS